MVVEAVAAEHGSVANAYPKQIQKIRNALDQALRSLANLGDFSSSNRLVRSGNLPQTQSRRRNFIKAQAALAERVRRQVYADSPNCNGMNEAFQALGADAWDGTIDGKISSQLSLNLPNGCAGDMKTAVQNTQHTYASLQTINSPSFAFTKPNGRQGTASAWDVQDALTAFNDAFTNQTNTRTS